MTTSERHRTQPGNVRVLGGQPTRQGRVVVRTAVLAVVVLLASALGTSSAATVDRLRVIVLVVDGLQPESVTPTLTPTLWSLIHTGQARQYTRAEGVMVSETNPNHTAMITGAYGDANGIVANFFHDHRTQTRTPLDRPSLILVETLFDAIERQAPKLRTASVMGKEKLRLLFDCTRDATGGCGASSDNPEGINVTHVRPDFVGGASTQFDPDRLEDDAVAEPVTGSGYSIDNEVIDIVAQLMAGGDPPDFTFVNLGGVDGFQHLFGARSPQGLAAVINADFAIGRLVDTLRSHDRWDDTALFVLADHSFQDTGDPVGTTTVQIGNPLTPHLTGGFISLPELLGSCTSGTSFTMMSFGGSASVAITDAGYDPFAGTPLTEAQRQCLGQLRARALAHPGVAEALYRRPVDGSSGLLAREHPEWHLNSPRLGELFLVAEDHASFLHSSTHTNAVVTGHHGSATTTAVPFIVASGSTRLATGTDNTHAAHSIDIAPTAAALLGIDPPAASQGRVLAEAFTP